MKRTFLNWILAALVGVTVVAASSTQSIAQEYWSPGVYRSYYSAPVYRSYYAPTSVYVGRPYYGSYFYRPRVWGWGYGYRPWRGYGYRAWGWSGHRWGGWRRW